MKKILKGILILSLLFSASAVAGWLYLRRSLPKTSGEIAIGGISSKIDIIRDKAAIPHIFASNDLDAFFAQGYVHAQDRMWQLEFQRRVGAGRLSEILGEKAVKTDKFVRTVGFYRSAVDSYKRISKRSRAILHAYVDGVNTWLGEGHPLSLEFTILDFKPEPWTPIDSLVWIKMMDLDLCTNYKTELRRVQLIRLFGERKADQLTPEYPTDGVSIIQPQKLPPKTISSLLDFHDDLGSFINSGGVHVGSNNWAVAGQHTKSGRPLLANDPHLGAGAPSVWYLNELKGKNLHVTGASLVGLPGVIVGHNKQIAWGVTNMGADVQDLYIEKINPDDPNQYEVNGKWVDMRILDEKIFIKDQEIPISWAARETVHGPMISDVIDSADLHVSLKWTALEQGDTTMNAFIGIDYAKNWKEFKKALSQYVAPIQNFVYADRRGNIGYLGYGKIPIRKKGDGMIPVPGWTKEYGWEQYIPYKKQPASLNPKGGYIVTANNRVIDKTYPYLISKEWASPYRAERIVELLKKKIDNKEKLTLEHMAEIQGDQKSIQNLQLLQYLLKVSPKNEKQKRAIQYLKNWDGITDSNSIATTIVQSWINQLGNFIIKDDLKEGQSHKLYTYFSDRRMALFLLETLKSNDVSWCDNTLTPMKEDCTKAVEISLANAIEELEEIIGPDMKTWKWGAIHKTQFPHRPFSKVPLLKYVFHREIENGGARSTVNPAAPKYSDGYKNYHIPSVRMIVDLSNFNNSRIIHTPGQSGNVMSKHYDDLMESHNEVSYEPMTFGKSHAKGDLLTMIPKGAAKSKEDRFFKLDE